jgi:hypothetical protein
MRGLGALSGERLALSFDLSSGSGGGGIRTHGTLARPTAFKAAPFDRSGTPPVRIVTDDRARGGSPLELLR